MLQSKKARFAILARHPSFIAKASAAGMLKAATPAGHPFLPNQRWYGCLKPMFLPGTLTLAPTRARVES